MAHALAPALAAVAVVLLLAARMALVAEAPPPLEFLPAAPFSQRQQLAWQQRRKDWL